MYRDEVLVIVATRDGEEQVILDDASVIRDRIDVGNPVGRSNGHLLVELPRETTRGKWRVWVEEKDLAATAL
jgi:hypothetical protein